MTLQRCAHVWQNRNGTNASQTMIKCRDCHKILAQIYIGCHRDQLAKVPEIKDMLEKQGERMQKQIDELTRELKDTTVRLENLSEAHQELEAQNEWLKVPNTKSQASQTLTFTELNTDCSHTPASSALPGAA